MATPKAVAPATELPKTMTINVPALGGLVTVKALTGDRINALRPVPYNPVMHTAAVIEAGTVSPKIDRAQCISLAQQHGEAPIMRVMGAILSVSGLNKTIARFVPREVVKAWYR
jgi:hypothetical protein